MRPNSIVRFEQAVYASLGLSLMSILTAGEVDTSSAPTVELPLSHVIVFGLVALGLSVLLIWLIARRASRVAKWIFVALAAMSFTFQLASPEWIIETDGLNSAIILGQDLLTLFALGMLFRPESSVWFRGDYAGVDTEIFR